MRRCAVSAVALMLLAGACGDDASPGDVSGDESVEAGPDGDADAGAGGAYD